MVPVEPLVSNSAFFNHFFAHNYTRVSSFLTELVPNPSTTTPSPVLSAFDSFFAKLTSKYAWVSDAPPRGYPSLRSGLAGDATIFRTLPRPVFVLQSIGIILYLGLFFLLLQLSPAGIVKIFPTKEEKETKRKEKEKKEKEKEKQKEKEKEKEKEREKEQEKQKKKDRRRGRRNIVSDQDLEVSDSSMPNSQTFDAAPVDADEKEEEEPTPAVAPASREERRKAHERPAAEEEEEEDQQQDDHDDYPHPHAKEISADELDAPAMSINDVD
jgi:hypothetical protein